MVVAGERLDSTNFRREYIIQDGHKNMCEYVDRTGRLSSKGTDKRKNPASSIRIFWLLFRILDHQVYNPKTSLQKEENERITNKSLLKR